jgi:ribosomal protein S18 acetylase RimI-like enzyme
MIEPAYAIRTFRFPDDVGPARDLWDSASPGIHLGRSDEQGEIARKLQRDPDLFLVAEYNGELVGTVIGGYDGRRGLIYHLAVHQDHRHHGIGTLLMDEVEARLAAKGCLKSYLMVMAAGESVSSFYTARGWERMDVAVFGKELR